MALRNCRGRRRSVLQKNRQYATRPRYQMPSSQNDFTNACKSAQDSRSFGPLRGDDS